MSAWAALAAKQVAMASGLAMSIVPGITHSTVDGFAVGALLSGLCFLLIMAPHHGLFVVARRRLARWRRQRIDVAHLDFVAGATLPDIYRNSGRNPLALEAAEMVVPAHLPEPADRAAPGYGWAGFRTRRRLVKPYVDDWLRPGDRRRAPRHAAPSVSISSRIAAMLVVHPLPVRS